MWLVGGLNRYVIPTLGSADAWDLYLLRPSYKVFASISAFHRFLAFPHTYVGMTWKASF